jgi:hypothetical protein
VAVALALTASAGAVTAGRVPGAVSFKACAGAGPYWPTETLTLYRASAWVACKEQGRLVRLSLATRKVVRSVRLDGPPIAVVAGYGSIWALDSSATLYRINPANDRIAKRIPLGTSAPYNLWIGGGSVWAVDDQAAQVVRVSPSTNAVVKRITVGDGAADMVFGTGSAWVIDHRDRTLMRIDLATNAASKLATLPGGAPERMVLLGGKLWVTGRGTDLLVVDPQTGAVDATIEIGAGGIDVVAAKGSLWVPSRNDEVDQTGFPTMETLRRVNAATREVTTVATAGGRVDVHGLVAQDGFVWLADNTAGRLYRLRA